MVRGWLINASIGAPVKQYTRQVIFQTGSGVRVYWW